MGKAPKVPAAPLPPPPPPDVFDAAVRSARAAEFSAQSRAKGRKRSVLTSAAGDQAAIPTVGGKTLLGQ